MKHEDQVEHKIIQSDGAVGWVRSHPSSIQHSLKETEGIVELSENIITRQ
ncbi:MAG: hypothetical protein AB1589_29660 [Cyanobacteriota bacterium]